MVNPSKKRSGQTAEQLFESLVDDWTDYDHWAKSQWDESNQQFWNSYHARLRACLEDLQKLAPDIDPQKIEPDTWEWFDSSIQEQSFADLIDELDRSAKAPTSAQLEEVSRLLETLDYVDSALRDKANAFLVRHGQSPALALTISSYRQLVDELEKPGNTASSRELDQLSRLLDSVDEIHGWLRHRGNAVLLQHGRATPSEPLPLHVYSDLVVELQKPRKVPSAYELDELSNLLGSLELGPYLRAQGAAILARYGRANAHNSSKYLS